MANSLLAFLPMLLLIMIISLSLAPPSHGARQLAESTQPMQFQYHKGPLLTGTRLSVNLVWYGNFNPSQRAILSDFVSSLSSTSTPNSAQPSVAAWWKSTHQYYPQLPKSNAAGGALTLGKQILDARYSLGKSLTSRQIRRLALRAGIQTPNTLNVVFTSDDVTVDGFCRSSCGNHGVLKKRVPFIWVGNSGKQCPGQCAWPFHKPIYGPQDPALVAPNGDVGVDGMVINLASLLVGTVTNPFGNGYYQGPKEAPLEAASACPGVYGKGAYPGYPGNLLVDPTSGGSYNANGFNGRKYLLPALYDPTTASCSTLVHGARQLAESTQPMQFQYHKGPLLTGTRLSVNLVWYGNFNPSQRAILSDFVSSLSSTSTPNSAQPSVAAWWKSTHQYYPQLPKSNAAGGALTLGKQILDARYSLGKSLTSRQIRRLALRAGIQTPNTLNVVFTSDDVTVDGFCLSSCGNHGVLKKRVPFIWVGNSGKQCPGQCAWPFHKPIYGPQDPALVAPNGDVGVDGMVINLASLLAGTVTNPFGSGYYQGPKEAPLEAASACPGVYGKGAYPGYPGNLLVDPTSGGSYNANGVNGRKYLLPALYDPTTASCSTLV
ncbi:hypothetical protein V2J09_013847 [Rumex salicifolius]